MKKVYLAGQTKKYDNRRLSKLFIFLLCSIFVLIFLWFFNKTFIEETYCQHKAEQIVGNDWNKTLAPTDEERAKGFSSNITWGHREELKCWKEFENRFPLI
jgi:hypothetical protein